MKRLVALMLLSLLLFSPFNVHGAPAGDEPLTLLNKPEPGNPPPPASGMTEPEAESLRDIYGPVTIEEPLPYILLAVAAITLLVLAATLFWFINKRPKAKAPPMPPWEKALKDLADARSLLTPEQGLAYMNRASNILRRYIESRFSIKSTRQTTREFLGGLPSVTLDSPLNTFKSELRSCLEQADMAKFAHRKPERQNLELMEEAVTTFVKNTRPNSPPEGRKP